MQLMLISHDRNTIRALKIALSKTMEDILPVTSAYSREQAVSQLKKEPAGLIVCDADMPGNEGIEILRELRGQNYRGGVIVISASCSPELTREALRLEAGDFLLKPVEEKSAEKRGKGDSGQTEEARGGRSEKGVRRLLDGKSYGHQGAVLEGRVPGKNQK